MTGERRARVGPGDEATGRRRDAAEGDVHALAALHNDSAPPLPEPAATVCRPLTGAVEGAHDLGRASLSRGGGAASQGSSAPVVGREQRRRQQQDEHAAEAAAAESAAGAAAAGRAEALAAAQAALVCFPQPQQQRQVMAAARPGVLHLFSGRPRSDSLAAAFEARGWATREVDVLRGGAGHDLTDDTTYRRLLRRAEAGDWRLAFIGTPCSTYSVARFRDGEGDARPLRRRSCGGRVDGMTFAEGCKADEADLLVRRGIAIARAIVANDGDVIFENPVDRGDRALSDSLQPRCPLRHRVFQEADHFPLWCEPEMQQYGDESSSRMLHFPMCAFGSPYQKWTSLMCTPRAAALLGPGTGCKRCDHALHEAVAAGYGPDGEPLGPPAGKYPEQLHLFWAAALAGVDGVGGLLGGGSGGDGGGGDGGAAAGTSVYLGGGAPVGDASRPRQRGFDAWLRDWTEAPALVRAMAESTAALGQFSMSTSLPERPQVLAGLVLESAEMHQLATQARPDWRGRHGPIDGAAPQVEMRWIERHPAAPVDVGHDRRQTRSGYDAVWVGRGHRRQSDVSDQAIAGALGNPFLLVNDRRPLQARQRLGTRDAACDAYAELLRAAPSDGRARDIGGGLEVVAALDTAAAATARAAAIDELVRRVRAGRSVQLMCSCHPQRCHADEIAALVLERVGWTEPSSNADLQQADPAWRPEGGAAGLFWDPADFEAIQSWRGRAMVAAQAMRDGAEVDRPTDLHIPAARMRPEARALAPWRTGGSFEHQPQPVAATADTPPACGLRADVFQRMARGGDEEIAGELPWGLEDDAAGLDTYLAFHHPSCYAQQRYVQAAVDAIDNEGPDGEGWLADEGDVPLVPLRAVPRGVVDQIHKLRVVTDHTYPFGYGISANDGVSVDHLPDIKLSSGVRYARMVATMQSARAGVLMWKRDAVSAYRQVPICPRDLWKCGVITERGFLVDTRLSFGARMAPNKFQRLMLVLMGEARRRMAAFDEQHPPTDAGVVAWLAARAERLGAAQAMLSAAVQYIDDTLGVSINDLVVATGRRRGEHHADIFDEVMAEAGVAMAEGEKRVNSSDDVEALGIGINAAQGFVYYPDKKRVRLEQRIAALLEQAGSGKAVSRADVESLMGKEKWVAHIAPSLQPRLRSACAMVHARGRPSHVVASADFIEDQKAILAALPNLPRRPLAPRAEFPQLDAADSTVIFQDASGSWGIGGFFVDGDDACYFSEPYPPDLLRALARRELSIGPAELAAELAAVLLAIERRGAAAPFFTDFTDNESARVAATKGTSGAASMAPMAHELASATAAAGVTLRTLRVTTKENAVSDALSRDGSTAELVVTPSEMYHDWVSRPQAVQVIVVV